MDTTPAILASATSRAVKALLQTPYHVATVYLSEKMTVRATRVRRCGKVQTGPRADISLTIGRPNFKSREFIKIAKKAGEPFPIKKVQLSKS